MARLWYGGSGAEFAIDLGADADIVDSAGTPTGEQGSAALLPLLSRTFDVYLDEALTTVTTDLIDSDGTTPITQITSNTDFAERATLQRFQAPDGHVGPVWIRVAGGTGSGFKVEPDSTTVFSRVGVLEGLESTRVTSDLADWSDTAPAEGQVPTWDSALGEWVPGVAAGTGTVTSVAEVDPVSGDVPAAALLAALGAATDADMDAVFESALFMVAQDGPGYPSHPSGSVWKGFVGTADPGVGANKVWFKPRTSA